MTSPQLEAAARSVRTEYEARPLNASRAKDRELMAITIEGIARELGAECARDDVLSTGREIHLRIKAPQGLELGLGFDGDSSQDREGTFCLPWCIWNGDAKLSEAFAAAARSSVNPHHRRKCTAFAYSFPQLCEMVRAGLTLANTGAAFQ